MAKLSFYTKEMAELCDSYIKKGYWRNKSFVDYWEQNAQLYSDKEALVDSRTRLTWLKVKQRVDRVAFSFLKLGLNRDESVAVLLPWCVEFCLIRAAHERAGIISIQLAPTLRHEELGHILSITEAKMVIIPWRYRDFDYFNMIEEIRPNLPHLEHILIVGDEVPEGGISFKEMVNLPLEEEFPSGHLSSIRHSPFEMSFLWHTTGTTGLPKLVENTQAAVEWVGRVHQSETGDKLTSSDVCGIICPAITGPNMLLFYAGSMVGAEIVLLEVFRPEEALQLIEREKITVFSAVPAQLGMMTKHPHFEKYDLSSLRFIVCAGASLAYQMALEAEEKFGCPIVQHYGSQENGVVTLVQHYTEPKDQRLLTVGRPSIANEVKIVDESGVEVGQGQIGEIMARGPMCGFGYYKDPEASLKVWTNDGWCNMGDLGKFDEQGNIVLIGRAKDMIIRGGQNIYPLEIENLLLTHPNVSDVAIVSMPDPVMGEKACAYVVPKAGQKFKFDEMVSFLKEKKIANYKLPERLEILWKLPTVAGLKIDKKALQQEIARKLQFECKEMVR